LNITNYREAIDRVAQTSLREMIGSSMLAALLSERTAADELLRAEIARKTADWGISVSPSSAIPVALQDAMSRQAQAERAKQSRVILGSAEAAIAGKFVEAAMTYADHPTALQLRAMNIIYETTKERGATILSPTSMVDSMNPVVALALAGQQTAPQKTSGPLPLSAKEGKEPVAAPQTAVHKVFPKHLRPMRQKSRPGGPLSLPKSSAIFDVHRQGRRAYDGSWSRVLRCPKQRLGSSDRQRRQTMICRPA
jgi:hypothetical protein